MIPNPMVDNVSMAEEGCVLVIKEEEEEEEEVAPLTAKPVMTPRQVIDSISSRPSSVPLLEKPLPHQTISSQTYLQVNGNVEAKESDSRTDITNSLSKRKPVSLNFICDKLKGNLVPRSAKTLQDGLLEQSSDSDPATEGEEKLCYTLSHTVTTASDSSMLDNSQDSLNTTGTPTSFLPNDSGELDDSNLQEIEVLNIESNTIGEKLLYMDGMNGQAWALSLPNDDNFKGTSKESLEENNSEKMSEDSNQPTHKAKRHATQYNNWHFTDMIDAVHQVQIGRMSITKAAKAYGIPRTTLRHYLCDGSKKLSYDHKRPPFTISPEQERELVDVILNEKEKNLSEKRLYSFSICQAQSLCKAQVGADPNRRTVPTQSWMRRFVYRHPALHPMFPSLLCRKDDSRWDRVYGSNSEDEPKRKYRKKTDSIVLLNSPDSKLQINHLSTTLPSFAVSPNSKNVFNKTSSFLEDSVTVKDGVCDEIKIGQENPVLSKEEMGISPEDQELQFNRFKDMLRKRYKADEYELELLKKYPSGYATDSDSSDTETSSSLPIHTTSADSNQKAFHVKGIAHVSPYKVSSKEDIHAQAFSQSSTPEEQLLPYRDLLRRISKSQLSLKSVTKVPIVNNQPNHSKWQSFNAIQETLASSPTMNSVTKPIDLAVVSAHLTNHTSTDSDISSVIISKPFESNRQSFSFPSSTTTQITNEHRGLQSQSNCPTVSLASPVTSTEKMLPTIHLGTFTVNSKLGPSGLAIKPLLSSGSNSSGIGNIIWPTSRSTTSSSTTKLSPLEISLTSVYDCALKSFEAQLGEELTDMFTKRYESNKVLEKLYSKWVSIKSDKETEERKLL